MAFCISSCFNRVIQTSLSVIISNSRDSVTISCSLGPHWGLRTHTPAILPRRRCTPLRSLELCGHRDCYAREINREDLLPVLTRGKTLLEGKHKHRLYNMVFYCLPSRSDVLCQYPRVAGCNLLKGYKLKKV